MISLITVALEAAVAIFSFFTKRAANKDALKDVMDQFSKKHDDMVQENIRLRKEYEELKKKILEDKKDGNMGV